MSIDCTFGEFKPNFYYFSLKIAIRTSSQARSIIKNLPDWFANVSLFINIGLLVWAIYERILSAKDKADIKASIRNWQHQAKGMSSAINRLKYSCDEEKSSSVWKSFSDKKDVGIALDALHEVSESMAESLYESRFFSEKELKDILKKDQETKEEREKNLKK